MDVGEPLSTDMWLPAPQQGVIGIEVVRAEIIPVFAAINHAPTMAALLCERALLSALGGDCRSPVAAHAHWQDGGRLRLDVEIYSEDGAEHVAGHAIMTGEGDAEALAHRLLGEAPDAVRRLFTA